MGLRLPIFAFGYFVLAYGKKCGQKLVAPVARSLAHGHRFEGKDGTLQ